MKNLQEIDSAFTESGVSGVAGLAFSNEKNLSVRPALLSEDIFGCSSNGQHASVVDAAQQRRSTLRIASLRSRSAHQGKAHSGRLEAEQGWNALPAYLRAESLELARKPSTIGTNSGGRIMLRDTGPPPGPEMRRPGFTTWPTRDCRFSEPTKDSYASGSQLSIAILRLARAALSAEELSEWIRGHVVCRQENMSRKGEICSR